MAEQFPSTSRHGDSEASTFSRVRPRLFGIAYRMLGSSAEAEDVVQDVWLRWQAADRREVLDPTAFLVTTTTRAAINATQSARARRETYVGPWLPEPIDTTNDPEEGVGRGEALELAVLTLLEKLSPMERAAYVLREAFDYSHKEVAEILQIEEANARQLVARARQHVSEERRVPVSSSEQRRLLEAFVAAAQLGDRAGLERLFAADVLSRTDGNGVARAAKAPVQGRERVARFIASFAPAFWPGTKIAFIEANGRPAFVVSQDGAPIAFATVDASDQGIEQIYWVMAPEKLKHVTAGAAPLAFE